MLPAGADSHRVSAIVEIASGKYADMIALTPAQAQNATEFRGTDTGRFKVSVRLDPATVPPAKRRADEFLTKVMESVEEQLQYQYVEDTGLMRLDDVVQSTKQSLEKIRAQTKDIEQQIREATGRADASVEAIRGSVPKLDDERQSLKLKVIGAQARQQALAGAIDRLAKAAGERAKDDPVAAELEKVVKGREMAVERLRKMQAAGHAGVSEAEEAETAVAEAKARMLERREVVKQQNGGELLAGLNRELATLSIDIAEAEATLAATEKVLHGYVKVQDLLTRSDDLRRERERAEVLLPKAQEDRAKAKAAIPAPALRVTSSGAATAEELVRKVVPGAEGRPPGSPAQP
jgi:hypothetical protein